MRGVRVPAQPGRVGRPGKHSLTQSHASQRSSVKYAEWVEGISFDAGTSNRFVQKAQIEMCIVSDEYGASAFSITHFLAHFAKYALQGIALGDRGPQRVMGVNPVYFQRGRFDVGLRERQYMKPMRFAAATFAGRWNT